MSTKQGAHLTATEKGYEMRLTLQQAIVAIQQWPERLTGREKTVLLRQLTTLQLPDRDLRQWLEEAITAK